MKFMLMFFDTAVQQGHSAESTQALQGRETATTRRVRDGMRQVQDGPFADTKEQLRGYFVIDVPTLDDALARSARSPTAATGTVEIRPVLAM